jgi:hypothetical protein
LRKYLPVYYIVEVILGIACCGDLSNWCASSDNGDFFVWDWLLLSFGAATFLFEVSFLAIVVASNVRLVAFGVPYTLRSAYVYCSSVRAIGRTLVLSLLFIVWLIYLWDAAAPSLVLLLAGV